MLPVKPALEVYPADRATESCPPGALHSCLSCCPKSPKMQELLSRSEAMREKLNDLKLEVASPVWAETYIS